MSPLIPRSPRGRYRAEPLLLAGCVLVTLVSLETWAIGLGWIGSVWAKVVVLLVCLGAAAGVGVLFARRRR